jgi:hypothetical protein
MRISRQFGLGLRVPMMLGALGLAVLVLGCLCTAAVVDRIVATVNHRAVLESEWDEAVRFESFMNGRSLKEVTAAERKQTLERLIDQTLIEEEMRNSSYTPLPMEEVTKRIRELREAVPAWKTEEGWRAGLAAFGLSQQDVEERVAAEANVLRYLDLRFRPEIHIDRRAVERYYLEQLVPELHRSGAAEVPLQQVSAKIEQVLIAQRFNEIQNQWVRALRAQAEINVR